MLPSAKFIGRGGGALDVDKVFATTLLTGTEAYTKRRVTNGLDLRGRGGAVFSFVRNFEAAKFLVDTNRGAGKYLNTYDTASQYTNSAVIPAFYNDGYDSLNHGSNVNWVDWAFCRAKRFFDVVTYTGNGVAGRQIPHGLGVQPGMIVVKRLDSADNWFTYHRMRGPGDVLLLNSTQVPSADPRWNNTQPNETHFYTNADGGVNASGGQYVAYLFAHDPSPSGIIQCGLYYANEYREATVALGWSPQFLISKCVTFPLDWDLVDLRRGWGAGSDRLLRFNRSDSEGVANIGEPTSTGFSVYAPASDQIYIYLAIRKGKA